MLLGSTASTRSLDTPAAPHTQATRLARWYSLSARQVTVALMRHVAPYVRIAPMAACDERSTVHGERPSTASVQVVATLAGKAPYLLLT